MSHLKTGGFVGSMAFNRFMKTSSTADDGDDGGYDYHDGGMFRRAWDAFLHVVRKEGSVVGEVAKSIVGDKKRKRHDTSGLERSVNTVSATCDVSDPQTYRRLTLSIAPARSNTAKRFISSFA